MSPLVLAMYHELIVVSWVSLLCTCTFICMQLNKIWLAVYIVLLGGCKLCTYAYEIGFNTSVWKLYCNMFTPHWLKCSLFSLFVWYIACPCSSSYLYMLQGTGLLLQYCGCEDQWAEVHWTETCDYFPLTRLPRPITSLPSVSTIPYMYFMYRVLSG